MSLIGGFASKVGSAAGDLAGQAITAELAPLAGVSAMSPAEAARANAASWATWRTYAPLVGAGVGLVAAAVFYGRRGRGAPPTHAAGG